MKVKLIKKYENYKEKQGTINDLDSVTNEERAEETDIYKCLEKYGITTLVNKTMAQEQLYLDNTNRNMTLDEAVRQRKQMDEYFLNQPASVRKVFGDSTETFYQKYKLGEFDEFLNTGVLSTEQVNMLKGVTNEQVEKDVLSNETIPTDISKVDNTVDGGNN